MNPLNVAGGFFVGVFLGIVVFLGWLIRDSIIHDELD